MLRSLHLTVFTMKSAYFCLIYALCFNCGHSILLPLVPDPDQEIRKLGHYGADPDLVSLSGFSSGAIWSTTYHTAFSNEIMGVGIINGGPAFCGFLGDKTFLGVIFCAKSAIVNNVSDLINLTRQYAKDQLIDSVDGMVGDKVFILNCAEDTFVEPRNGQQIEEYYEAFGADIKTKFDIPGEHAMITNDVPVLCPDFQPFWLSKCNSYDAAFELLNHIYGNLYEPRTCNMSLNGELYRFDQSEFTAPKTPNDLSMADYGNVYVPSYCKTNPGCKVHVANHGCVTGSPLPYEPYVKYSGYNDVAEVNNIIVVYPQMKSRLPEPGTPGFDQLQPFNPIACHDWYGYTTDLYAAKSAPQMMTFNKMIKRLSSTSD